MQNEFKDRLSAIRASANQVYTSSNDVATICQEAMKELSAYETIIPEFFSYKNEAVRIKELYKRLKGLDYARNRVIPCIDVSCANYLYNDYFTGMYNFLDKFFATVGSNGADVATMETQLDTAIKGDPLFIESLFGGKNNEAADEVLTDAISNVEYLVDFLDRLKGMKQMVADVCNRASEMPSYEHAVRAVKLIVNSTCVFSNRVLETIMNTYVAIHNRLDDKCVLPAKDTSFKVF